MKLLLQSRSFWGILLLALLIRIAAAFWWQNRMTQEQRFYFGDSNSYEVLAKQIAQGKPYLHGKDPFFRTPGYPVAIAPFYLFDAEPAIIWVRCGNAIWGILAIALIGLFAGELFDNKTGIIAALLATVYPGAIAMSVFVLSEAVFCPLMILQLWLWRLAIDADQSKTRLIAISLITGIVFAAAVLVRPSWLLFPPFALIFGLLFYEGKFKQLQVFALMMVGSLVLFTPWWVRNYQLSGRFIPTTLQVGASLYDGLSPQATGASDMQFVAKFKAEQIEADAKADSLKDVFEYRLNERMKNEAIGWATENPRKVFNLALIKFVRMWNLWPNEQGLSSWQFKAVTFLGYVPLLTLGLWGLIQFSRLGFSYLLCFIPVFYFTCLHLFFVSSIRYRQPAMLVLCVLAAGVLAKLLLAKEIIPSDEPKQR